MTKQPSKGYYKYPNENLHERLAETHDRLVAVEVAMRDHVDPGLARMAAELAVLQGLAEKGFNPDFVSAKLDSIEKGIADHEIRISGLEASVEVLIDNTSKNTGNIRALEEASSTTIRRVAVLERMIQGDGFPFVQVFLGIIAGIFAGWLWHNHDFSSTFTVGEQSGTAESAADWLISAILFGIGAGLAVMALAALLNRARYRASVEEASIRREANDVFNRRTSVRTDQALDTSPTELLPTQPVVQNS